MESISDRVNADLCHSQRLDQQQPGLLVTIFPKRVQKVTRAFYSNIIGRNYLGFWIELIWVMVGMVWGKMRVRGVGGKMMRKGEIVDKKKLSPSWGKSSSFCPKCPSLMDDEF